MLNFIHRGRGTQVGLGILLLILLALAGWQLRSPSAGSALSGGVALPTGARLSNSGVVADTPPLVAANKDVLVGQSYKNDVSPPLRSIPPLPWTPGQKREANENPPLILSDHKDVPDTVVQQTFGLLAMPAPILNFNGIAFPGVNCNCAPPDTNGEVGATQYVQMVNEGYQVFNKGTGASVLGPVAIDTLWSGFGAPCNAGSGDPVVLYDQLANRWLVSQFAGVSTITDECIAISTTSDATGSYFRYGFHLGSNFMDYPHLSVWPDGYYMGANIFNSSGTQYLGPQPFVFDRARMLNGQSASFQTTSGPLSASLSYMLPADLDGSILPPAGAPNPYLGTAGNTWPLYRFHVDWATPANTSFTSSSSLTPAGWSELCAGTRNCVPQPGTTTRLDGIGDRAMFRSAYRRFADGHEALVGNKSVSAGGVSGIRWWEISNVTAGTPSFVQQSTYQPDTTWRWMGSIAMDQAGNLAVGYSASSSSVNPSLRYAGRLATDPPSQLSQGEATLFAGLGSQSGTSNRWGDYSDLTVDPSDDCTFWYTNEYYPSGVSQFNWRTRIGSFTFPTCGGGPGPTATPVPPTATPVPPTPTPPSGQSDFTLIVTPTSQTVARPGSTTYTVNLSSVNGFAGSVSLSVSGLPSKTSGSFSPGSVTLASGGSGSSTLTITAANNGPRGTYTLTVTGTGGGQTHSQTVTLILTR
jgi:hypothetical protein